MIPFLPRPLPRELEKLAELALDLRWTWSHAGDALWRWLDPVLWDKTRNPWILLHYISEARLEEGLRSAEFMGEFRRLVAERQDYLECKGWCQATYASEQPPLVAYFSMEYGLSEALPLYAGGLGMLAGDYLKAASDLDVPLVAVGLLYQEGYFRQVLDAAGRQQAMYPPNNPHHLPIQPVMTAAGSQLHIKLRLPGRTLYIDVWRANVGRITLILLDCNDPLNTPADRGITSQLYGGGPEVRFMQEVVLGIGGWRALEALELPVEVCHLNEGHAAFVVLERARGFMKKAGVSFWEALWATRAGNVFTSHTPVPAGFDVFPKELIERYFVYIKEYLQDLGIGAGELLALGRAGSHDPDESFNMAYLALRGCGRINAVSRLHGQVSRHIFGDLFAHWPEAEVPVGHVTNGVHIPSWDSPWADQIWTRACGKDRWRGAVETLSAAMSDISDEQLWAFRTSERHDLVSYVRRRQAVQWGQRGIEEPTLTQLCCALDPNILTLGFARRFAEYKRPNLLLQDKERLRRLLNDPQRPVQIAVAGKAHPADEIGKRLVQEWAEFAQHPELRSRVVFLEDYDITLAQELVQGVDVWLNTPRRPWEACGTSGMKVLVNGGLNLSSLDGWWAEAYRPEVGWVLGNDNGSVDDVTEAQQLYALLEQHVVPEFYDRDAQGIPRAWVARIRRSMAELAPQYSSNRMAFEYVDGYYMPAARAVRHRSAEKGRLAGTLRVWEQHLSLHWQHIHFGHLETASSGDQLRFKVPVFTGDIMPDSVQVQLYAEARGSDSAACVAMERGEAVTGGINGHFYHAEIASTRSPEDFTPRVVPWHPDAAVPLEVPLIAWQR